MVSRGVWARISEIHTSFSPLSHYGGKKMKLGKKKKIPPPPEPKDIETEIEELGEEDTEEETETKESKEVEIQGLSQYDIHLINLVSGIYNNGIENNKLLKKIVKLMEND